MTDRMTQRVRSAADQLLFVPLDVERDRYVSALRIAGELSGRVRE